MRPIAYRLPVILSVGASRLAPVSTTGTWHRAHCYDGSNAVLNESCQGD